MNHYLNNLVSCYTKLGSRQKTRWLAFAVAMLLIWASAAVAADIAITPTETSLTLRDSIDKTKKILAESLFGLQLSGFGDVLSHYDDAGKQKFDWGTFELDASADITRDLQAALALVNDPTGTALSVGFLDYHTYGGSIAPRGRLWVEKGLHIQAGRFDVPFGNDWQFFASRDSVSISRPLTTELVMEGGYNDKGMRVLGNNGSINFNAYFLRGFNAGRLIGGRLGVTPFSDPFSINTAKEPKTFEFGLSYFYDSNAGWKKNETGFAADAEIILDDWSGRFEYLVRKKEPVSGMEKMILRGWHFTQEYQLDEDETTAWPTKLFLRYEQGAVNPPEIATLGTDAGNARDVRVAAGFRTNLGDSDVLQFKFEVQHYRAATPATRALPGFDRNLFWLAQLVLVL